MKGKNCNKVVYTVLFAVFITLYSILPGCSETVPELLPNPPQLPQSFTCEIHFTIEGLEGTAQLSHPGRSEELQPSSAAPLNPASGLEICFSAPETLSGVSILCLDDLARIQIDDVTVNLLTAFDGQNASLPEGSLISILSKAIEAVSLSSQAGENWSHDRDSDNWVFTGSLDGGLEGSSFRLTVSNDGLPIDLAVDDAGISVQFSQVCPVL